MTEEPVAPTTVCRTCRGAARVLCVYSRGPTSPPGNAWVGCPHCEAGVAYSAALAEELVANSAKGREANAAPTTFGPRTEAAARAYCADVGLDPDENVEGFPPGVVRWHLIAPTASKMLAAATVEESHG